MCVESNWNVMAHGDAREGNWKGNWRMECVASTLHTTSEHGVSNITRADAHTSAASSRLNWRPCRFKWTRPFRRDPKSDFCACAITYQTQSTNTVQKVFHSKKNSARYYHKCTSVCHVKFLLFSLDINENCDVWQTFKKSSNMKFHENPSSGHKDGQTRKQKDMTKLRVAFRNFENAPKNMQVYLSLWRAT